MTLSEALRRNGELEAALVARDMTIAQLQEQIRLLQERLAQNSTNSSKPPSSDGPAVKRPPRSHKSGRRRGAQQGHTGHARALLPHDQVDEIVDCVPETCRHCGAGLSGSDPEPEWQQVVDLPEPVVIVREYRWHRRRCGVCGRVTVGALPEAVSLSHFGSRLYALAALMTGCWRLSKRQVGALLGLLFGLDVSLGSVSSMKRRVAAALATPYAAALAHVQAAAVVHADNTGWREAKSRAWLWLAAMREVAAFLIQRRRSGKAAKALLGANFAGAMCVDRWSAYTWVARRGLCGPI
jgi:transposase